MRIKSTITILSIAFIVICSYLSIITTSFGVTSNEGSLFHNDSNEDIIISNSISMTRSRSESNNTEPILSEASVYSYDSDSGPEAAFGVYYQDLDGDKGEVFLYLDDVKYDTIPDDIDPVEGIYYEAYVLEEKFDDNSEFYYFANDSNGSTIYFPGMDDELFLVGDYLGWGVEPVLSAPDVYFDGDDWVFNVTYQDPDGDDTEDVWLYLDDVSMVMKTNDTDPFNGQNFMVRVLEEKVTKETEFYFETSDTGGSWAALYDDDTNFVVDDFLEPDDNEIKFGKNAIF